MSTKFSAKSNVAKTPGVCRKPPPRPTYQLPPIDDLPFDGFMTYYDLHTTPEGGLTVPIPMSPSPLPLTWSGSATTGIWRAVLLMIANLTLTELAFRLDVYANNFLTATYIMSGLPARSWSPFDSGYHGPAIQPLNGRVGWRVWF